MTTQPTKTVRISGEDLANAMQKLETAGEGLTFQEFYIALIGAAIVTQHPTIDPADLSVGIRGCSEWITDYLDSVIVPKSVPPASKGN